MMTEGKGSKHFILCDYCGKTFRHEESYKEHRKYLVEDFSMSKNNILLNMDNMTLNTLKIIGWIGSLIVAATITVVIFLSHCKQEVSC